MRGGNRGASAEQRRFPISWTGGGGRGEGGQGTIGISIMGVGSHLYLYNTR